MLKDTKANKIFLIILVCVLALVFSFDHFWEKQGRDNRGEESFTLQDSDSLTIKTINNNITLEIDPAATKASASIGGNETDNLTVVRNGNEVTIQVSPLNKRFISFIGGSSSRLVVTIPSVKLNRVEIASTNGEIDIMQDMEAKQIEIKNISGDIDLLNLKAEDTLSLSTISGQISGFSAASDKKLTISTTSGGIDLNKVQGLDIKLQSISSSIETEVELASKGDLKASSTSGRLDLKLIKAENLNLDATTISGSITFNDLEQEGKKASLETGDANTDVQLSSVSGSIDIHY